MDITIEGIILSESKLNNGHATVKIIQPGWGSSGYYSAALLQRDAPLFEGAQMYWNHPRKSDEWERPERDLNDLAAVLTGVSYQESGPDGAGIYGDAMIFKPYQQAVSDIGSHIGVSIRALGQGREGAAEGRDGLIIERITVVESVDFVTRAGAGGKILAQFNEAGTPAKQKELQLIESEDDMELKEALDTIQTQATQLAEATTKASALETQLKEATDKIATLETAVARSNEAILASEAMNLVTELVGKSQLPDVTKKRIIESLGSNPIVKDGALDKAATETAVTESIKAEAEYIAAFAGGARITGMGSGAGGTEVKESDLNTAFSRIGMSESAAKLAASGRK